MNLYVRELKSHRKGLFFWSVGMVLLISSSMAKYATINKTGQSLTQMMEQFPHAIQVIFGINGFDLSTASGYFGVVYLYIALMVAVHAVLLGSEIISKEERDRTSEFLFVKPISRQSVITNKLLAGLTCLMIFNLVTLFSSVYFVDYFSKGASINSDIFLLMLGILFLQLLFFFIGVAVAAVNKKPKTSASIATSVLLVTFILSFLTNFNSGLDKLRYFTPFKYFEARLIITNGGIDSVFVILSLVVIASLTVVSYVSYTRRDLVV